MTDLLEVYGKEIGIANLTLETLIESHRLLRSEYMKACEQALIDLEKVRVDSTTEWVKIDDLRNMTIGVLADMLEAIEDEQRPPRSDFEFCSGSIFDDFRM